jgi:hypothetical protein
MQFTKFGQTGLPTEKMFLDLSDLPTQILGRIFAIWIFPWTSHSPVAPPPTGRMFVDLSAHASPPLQYPPGKMFIDLFGAA